ncbi:hypothetical protein RJT34_17063 [Clitoria ternatea]|uniref:Transcription repressor n=1 Tax=Clitoria ternatea TaxID=43366 RepID=A0AAN9JAE7_CLITE
MKPIPISISKVLKAKKMPKNIQKSLQDYLSKIKSPRSQLQLPSKKWILSGCKHPRTPSFALEDKKNKANKDDEATLADVDRFLFENFKSLYLKDDDNDDKNNKSVISEEETLTHTTNGKAPKLGPILFDSSRRFEEYSTHDLFMSGEATTDDAGSSSNISTTMDNSSSENEGATVPENCVVVVACSPSPYEDFRRSMEGIVEARMRNDEKVDWDLMEELLFCHINLNHKKTHKFILSAFVDVISAMRRQPETKPKPRSVRTVRIGREVRKKTKEVTLEFGFHSNFHAWCISLRILPKLSSLAIAGEEHSNFLSTNSFFSILTIWNIFFSSLSLFIYFNVARNQ